MSSRNSLPYFGLLLVLLAIGCGGGSGSGGGNGTTTATTTTGGGGGLTLMDSTKRSAIIDQAQAAFSSVPETNGIKNPQAVLAALKAVPGLQNLQQTPDGTVAGTFPDNVPVSFFNNQPANAFSIPADHPMAKPLELPSSSSAKVLDTEDPILFKNRVNDDPKMFSDNGYPGTTLTLATIEAFRALGNSPMGCFYFSGHGGPAFDPLTKRLASYGFWTATRAVFKAGATFNGGTYDGDLRDGSLAIGFAANDSDPITKKEIIACHYMALPNFLIKYHWKFSKNSFVSLGCCASGSADAATLISTLFHAGASVIANWTDETYSNVNYYNNSYLFDRMLGANAFNATTPPRRSFPYSSILPVLQKKGYVSYTAAGHPTVWTFTPNPAIAAGKNFTILNPTLQSLSISIPDKTVTLQGDFGSDQGKVTIGSAEASVISWASDFIVCKLPDTGIGSVGDVIAEITPADGGPVRKSNARQISSWIGTITDSQVADSGGTIGNAQFKVNFRADVGPVYLEPDGTLQANGGAAAWKPGLDNTILNAIKPVTNSTSSVTAGGTFTDSIGDKYVYTYVGPSAYPVQTSGNQANFFTVVLGVPSTPGLPGAFRLGAVASNALNVTITHPDGSKFSTTSNQIFQTTRDIGGNNHGDALTQFDARDNMQGGTESSHSGLMTETVNWGPFECTAPPDLTRAR